ncbi:MAG: xanthine dehydrogenase large subunit, partial [Psychroserpens sp.]
MFVIESAIVRAASEIGITARAIQEVNLLDENDMFSYGQIAKKVEAKNTWDSAKSIFKI